MEQRTALLAVCSAGCACDECTVLSGCGVHGVPWRTVPPGVLCESAGRENTREGVAQTGDGRREAVRAMAEGPLKADAKGC